MALVAVSALALLPSNSAAWSSSVDALLAKFEPDATDATTVVGLTPLTGYELSYAYTSKHITFAVVADTSGWIGLGIGEAAGMKAICITVDRYHTRNLLCSLSSLLTPLPSVSSSAPCRVSASVTCAIRSK